MVHLPRTCPYCSAKLMHYGACNCPDATVDWVDAEREAIKTRLARLAVIEKEAVRKKLVQLGVIGDVANEQKEDR